ncbi:MAG: hypothetical protein JNL01_16760 [Bdellovibrionales bacterium]|nr:hypothetical protein [Bdellovibrionales bacterium]
MTNPFFGFLAFLVTSTLSIAALTLSWAQQERSQDITDQELKTESRNQKHTSTHLNVKQRQIN